MYAVFLYMFSFLSCYSHVTDHSNWIRYGAQFIAKGTFSSLNLFPIWFLTLYTLLHLIMKLPANVGPSTCQTINTVLVVVLSSLSVCDLRSSLTAKLDRHSCTLCMYLLSLVYIFIHAYVEFHCFFWFMPCTEQSDIILWRNKAISWKKITVCDPICERWLLCLW